MANSFYEGDGFFDHDLDEETLVSCHRCEEEYLHWEQDARSGKSFLADEDGDRHICDQLTQAEGFGEVTDDSN